MIMKLSKKERFKEMVKVLIVQKKAFIITKNSFGIELTGYLL